MGIGQALSDGFYLLGEKWVVVLGVSVAIGPTLFFCFSLLGRNFKGKMFSWQAGLLPGFFFLLSMVLRLAFLKNVFVPPYFDSAEHYRIVNELTEALRTSTLAARLPILTHGYYHLGFHFLAALLALVLRAYPMDVILVLGQVILAVLPVPIFFLLWHKTQNIFGAFFGMFLAGFGWYMPGFAINWGKYPALAGLLALEVVLILAYALSDRNTSNQHRRKPDRKQALLPILLIAGILVSTFFHTRTLVVLVLCFLSWFLARQICILPRSFQYLAVGILFVGVLLFGTLVRANLLVNLALDPYVAGTTLIVTILAPFALVEYTRGFYFNFLFIPFVFATPFIPAGIRTPGLENQTLLDRPFVEMALYLPLSLLGGLGLAGLLRVLKNNPILPPKLRLYAQVLIPILLVSFTGWSSLRHYDFYPSDCCNLVGYDDTITLDWIKKNLPPDALILVAAAPLNVLSSSPAETLTGTDAGIWLPALTGRQIVLAPFETDFDTESTLEKLCQMQADFIYAGGGRQSFNVAQLQASMEWYDRILFLPKAQIYQLIGCK